MKFFIKGIISHPEMIVPCTTLFCGTREDILKNVGKPTVLVPSDFHCLKKKSHWKPFTVLEHFC